MASDAPADEVLSGLPVGLISPRCEQIVRASGANAYERLVVPDGAGSTDKARDQLRDVTPEELLAKPIRAADEAHALLSALWLWHDRLDESHTISQGIPSATGSFWHAIMHRREGDFSNSKYWYARCRAHPALAAVGASVQPIWSQLPRGGGAAEWSPDGFVDLVERVHGNPGDPAYALAVRIQRAEWLELFRSTALAATGESHSA